MLFSVSCTVINDIKTGDFKPPESNEDSAGITEETDYEKQERQRQQTAELLRNEKEAVSLSWEETKTAALSEPSLMPVYRFINSLDAGYYEEYRDEIENFFEEMRGDPQYYRYENLDELEYFIDNFPEHIYIVSAEEQKKEFEKNLIEFAREQKISGTITGNKINEIDLSLRNNTDSRLIAHLPIGLYFMANSGNVQNMVLLETVSVSVSAGGNIRITAPVACMNIYKDIPGADDLFFLGELEEDDPLLELLDLFKLYGAGFEVIQAAVWLLRDNPGRLYMLDALEYDDGEKIITEEVYAEAERLVGLIK